MQLYEYKPFQKCLNRLARKGHAADMPYRQAIAAIHDWRNDRPTTLPTTKNGENRIPHAVKYDLHGSFRLVTVEHEDARILIYIGSHEDAEHWLDTNRGTRFVVDKKGQIEFTRVDATPKSPDELQDVPPEAPRLKGPVLRLLPDGVRELLDLPRAVLLSLELITFELLVDNESAWEIVHSQPYVSDEQRSTVLDAIDHLRHGRLKQAIARVDFYAEEATADSEALEKALKAGTSTDTLANLSRLTDDECEHRFRNSGYAEWLLFLHPDQQKHVDVSHGGPARLIGVSGSGKTCVLVHRASALAKLYPGEKILVLVLNEALRQLLTSLVAHLCPEEQQRQIEVMRIYDYCYNVAKATNPSRLINPIDEVSGEDLAACWSNFVTRRHVLEESKSLRASIKAMNVEPWGYIHDELIWLRTGQGGTANERRSYLTTERKGRSMPFPICANGQLAYDSSGTQSGFKADARVRVIKLLDHYEEYMDAGGLLDEDGVALMAFENREAIPAHPSLCARCVLVDEVQDCSTVQLGVIAMIPTNAVNGLMLVGDPVQKVFPRQQHLRSAGIDIRGRSTRLNTNYRNTREILDAAYPIIDAYGSRSPVPEDEILRPEMACRNGPRPKLVQCDSVEEQWACVAFLIQLFRDTGASSVCVGSPRPAIRQTQRPRRNAPPTPPLPKVDDRLLRLCNDKGWLVTGLGGQVHLDTLADSIVGARFEDMKGFEFKNVLLVDLQDKHLVHESIPADERWRVAFQLYVAMTRAQEELWLFSVGPTSRLLHPLKSYVDVVRPSELIGKVARDPIVSVMGLPLRRDSVVANAEVDGGFAESGYDNTLDTPTEDSDSESEVPSPAPLELPFEPESATTAQLIAHAQIYLYDVEILERIVIQLGKRDCTGRQNELAALRERLRSHPGKQSKSQGEKADEYPWPTQAVVSRSEALGGEVFQHIQGMLSFMGYRVGESRGLYPTQRRKILGYVFRGELPRLNSDSYSQEWGRPGSRTRLNKITNSLMAFIRNAERRGRSMKTAIIDWQEDLRFVRETFG